MVMTTLADLTRAVFPILQESNGRYWILGSGCYFQRNNRLFVVSATHVLKELKKHSDNIAIPRDATNTSTKPGDVWTLGDCQLAETEEDKFDVSVVELKSESVRERIFNGSWTILDDRHVSIGEQGTGTYAFFGWPDSRRRVKETGDGCPHVVGEAFGRETRRMAPPSRLSLDAIPPNETDVWLAWPPGEVPRLAGISGSPIWELINDPRGPEFRLAAVQHRVGHGEYVRGTQWMVAHRIINEFLKT